MKYLNLLLIILLFFSKAHAWSSHGHLLITQIAFDQLSDDVLDKVNNDLKGFNQFFPKYSHPLAASIWPDLIRSFGVDTFTTWHYIDSPYNPHNITGVNEPSNINVQWALDQTYNTLLSEDSKDNAWTRNFMLRFLLHLAGDIHQPFHNTEYFSENYSNGDEGGNKIWIWYNWKYMNLHSFWDTAGELYNQKFIYPLQDNDLRMIKQTANSLQKKYPKLEEDELNFKKWSNESHQLAVNFGYPEVLNSRTLTCEYIEKTRNISEIQMVKAGYRLANLLNSIYDKPEIPCVFDYCYLPLDLY